MRVIPGERRARACGWRSAGSSRSPDRAAIALLVLLALAAGGCRREPPPATAAAALPERDAAAEIVESPSMEFLPRLEEAPGWSMIGDPLVFPSGELPSYLGIQAEQYLAYELVDLTVGEYERADQGDGRATVEIYRFPDFVKAFGSYSMRRRGGGELLDLPNEGFIGRHSIQIWRGPFFVRVVFTGGPDAREHALELARTVVGRMPAAPGKPAVFGFFPEQTRVRNSETYSAGPVFGQPYLAGGFTATFAAEPQPVEGVIVPAPSKEVATEILDRWRSFFATNGRLLDPVPNLGEDNLVGEDRFAGRTVAFRLDRFVVAFRGFGDKQPLIDLAIATDRRILASIRAQLQAAERAAREASRRAP